jgi:hypothetical protein
MSTFILAHCHVDVLLTAGLQFPEILDKRKPQSLQWLTKSAETRRTAETHAAELPWNLHSTAWWQTANRILTPKTANLVGATLLSTIAQADNNIAEIQRAYDYRYAKVATPNPIATLAAIRGARYNLADLQDWESTDAAVFLRALDELAIKVATSDGDKYPPLIITEAHVAQAAQPVG